MAVFGKSWKTSLGGLGMILGALSDIVHGLSASVAINWQADITAIIGGIGLLCAKDSNVTGGTVMQPTPAPVLVQEAAENARAGVK